MSYSGYKLSSPAIQHDYDEFLKTNPDLYTMVDWLKEHVKDTELLDYNHGDPEELFEYTVLESWATKNGWKCEPSINDFPEEDLVKWAKDHDFVKREDITDNYNIQNMIENSDCQFALEYFDHEWVIYDLKAEETVISASELWELEDEAGKYLDEQIKIRSKKIDQARKEALAAQKAMKKRGRKPGTRNGEVSPEEKAEKDLREFARKQGLKIIVSNKSWKSEKFHIVGEEGRISMYAKTIQEAYDLINHREEYRYK